MSVKTKYRNGSWWVYVNHNGRRKAKKAGDRSTAVRVAQAIRERIARSEFSLPLVGGDQTLGAFAGQWLAGLRGSLKGSTVAFYESNLSRHVLRVLGGRPVASIKREDCLSLIADLRSRGLKLNTIKGIVRTLSAVLSEAVESGLLNANPALKLGKYLRQGDEPEPEIQPLSRDEVRHLLAVADEFFPGWYTFLLCAVRTGMRQGELLGLHWSDVDLSGGFLMVRRNLVRGVLTTPKTRKGRRRVDLSRQLVDSLSTHYRLIRERCLVEGCEMSDWVFPSSAGTALDEANVRHMFYRILSKAKLRRIRFHDLRHTYASLLIQQEESLAYVQEQLGHSSISVTVDVYGHLVPGGNRAAVARLDDGPDATICNPYATGAAPEGSEGRRCSCKSLKRNGEPPGTRTPNPQIKSLLLCQLS